MVVKLCEVECGSCMKLSGVVVKLSAVVVKLSAVVKLCEVEWVSEVV